MGYNRALRGNNMKFLVDEMPYFLDDCPFYEFGSGLCKCNCNGDNYCTYFENDRNPEYCPWLKENEND